MNVCTLTSTGVVVAVDDTTVTGVVVAAVVVNVISGVVTRVVAGDVALAALFSSSGLSSDGDIVTLLLLLLTPKDLAANTERSSDFASATWPAAVEEEKRAWLWAMSVIREVVVGRDRRCRSRC